MPLEGRDLAYLRDVLDHAQEVRAYAADLSYTRYKNDRTWQLVVERVLQIIGEAANHVSVATRAAHPEIAWGDIIGQRDVLSHKYGNIDHDELWNTVTLHVPVLIRQLEAFIPPAPDARPHGWDTES